MIIIIIYFHFIFISMKPNQFKDKNNSATLLYEKIALKLLHFLFENTLTKITTISYYGIYLKLLHYKLRDFNKTSTLFRQHISTKTATLKMKGYS